MSYGIDYLDINNQWCSNIHCFITKKEAKKYGVSHMESCNKTLGKRQIKEIKVVYRREVAEKGWIHGRLVSLYPMAF